MAGSDKIGVRERQLRELREQQAEQAEREQMAARAARAKRAHQEATRKTVAGRQKLQKRGRRG